MRDRVRGVAVVAALAISCGWALAAQAQDRDNKKANSDQTFAMNAGGAGLAEVNLGQLAARQAMSDEVKKFGQQMVDDHGKANRELLDIAAKKKILLPARMEPKYRQVMDRLLRLRGAEFDRAYMKQMVDDHKEAVTLFESESKNGQDADLKAFAGRALPTIKHHLEMAEKFAGSKDSKKDGDTKSEK